MSKKYYYGLPDSGDYYSDLELAVESAIDEIMESFDDATFTIIELTPNRKKAGFCLIYGDLIDGECGDFWCGDYDPKNGKSGICKYKSCGLSKTGREWEVNIKMGTCKKISCRKKK